MPDIHINDGTVPFTERTLGPIGASAQSTLIANGTAAGLTAPPMSYAWTRDGAVVPGATGRSYVSDAILDAYSIVQPTITDSSGVVARPAAFFLQPNARRADFTIALDGPANVGQPCTFTADGDFGQPHVRFEPVWKVDGVVVGTNLYYTFKAVDEGKAWTLSVSGINTAGTHIPAALSGTVGAGGTIVQSGTRDPGLAYNLNGWNDYSPEDCYIDWMKTARYIFMRKDADGKEVQFWPKTGLDENGWPTHGMPDGASRLRILWAKDKELGDPALAQNPFRVTWEGSFNPTGGYGISITNKTPTSATINLTEKGNLFIDFTSLIAGANYMRNVRIVPQKWAAIYDAGERFNPDWLDGPMRNVRMVRAIGWNKIFTSPVREFSELIPVDYATYNHPNGVPLQIMADIANRLKCDLWYCFPTLMGDDAAAKVAAFFRDALDLGLTCYYEYGCENWNYGIGYMAGESKFRWQQILGTEKFGPGDQNIRGETYITMRSTQLAQIVIAAYAGSGKLYHNTFGIQTVGVGFGTRQLHNYGLWEDQFPDEAVPLLSVLDSIAATCYVSANALGDQAVLDGIMAAAATSPKAAEEFIYQRMMDPANPGGLVEWKKVMAETKNYASTNPIKPVKLVCYEGGFHTIHSFGTNFNIDVEPAGQALYAFEDSDRALEIYAAMFDICMTLTDGPYMQLHNVSTYNSSGVWGSYLPGNVPMRRGRLQQSMSMTRSNIGRPPVTDDRYMRLQRGQQEISAS